MALEQVVKYPAIFFVSLAVTFVLTPVVRRVAVHFGVVDQPSARRINKRPVPRCGGVAVFLGFHAGCALVFFGSWGRIEGALTLHWWYSFLIASSVLLLLGLVDDAVELRPWIKLLGQITVAILLFHFDIRVGRIHGINLPWLADFGLTIFWVLAFINAFNLIDGMDGLASGLATIAALGLFGERLFRHYPSDALIALALIGACVAFLRYNFYPASIFLGDTGSMFLGIALASFSLSASAKGTALTTVGVPLLAVGVPMFDTMLAVWRRSVRNLGTELEHGRGGIMSGDMEHLHHRMIRSGLTQRGVALWLYAANALLVSVGLLGIVYNDKAIGIYLIAFVIGSYVVVRHVARVEIWDSSSAILKGLRRPRKPLVAGIFYPTFDFLSLTAALAFSLWLSDPQLDDGRFLYHWFENIPLWACLPFICLFFTGTYSRVWSRARVSEFAVVALALVVSLVLVWAFMRFDTNASVRITTLQAFVYFSVAAPAIVGIRAFPRIIEDVVALLDRRSLDYTQAAKRVLIYGAGNHCLLYLKQQVLGFGTGEAERIVVGLVDDDRHLRKRLIHGYRVLGEGSELRQLIAKLDVNQLVIAAELSEEQREHVRWLAGDMGVALSEWRTEERTLIEERAAQQEVSTKKVVHFRNE